MKEIPGHLEVIIPVRTPVDAAAQYGSPAEVGEGLTIELGILSRIVPQRARGWLEIHVLVRPTVSISLSTHNLSLTRSRNIEATGALWAVKEEVKLLKNM